MVGPPQSSAISTLIAVLGSGHTRKQINAFEAVIRHAKKHARGVDVRLKAVLRRMQLTLHATRRAPHGSSRLVSAIRL